MRLSRCNSLREYFYVTNAVVYLSYVQSSLLCYSVESE